MSSGEYIHKLNLANMILFASFTLELNVQLNITLFTVLYKLGVVSHAVTGTVQTGAIVNGCNHVVATTV